VQFGPVVADGVAGQFAPEAGKSMADDGKRAWQEGRRGTRNGQYRPSHHAIPIAMQALFARIVPLPPDRRPASWTAIVARQGLKLGQRTVLLRRKISISLSRVLPGRLALLPLGRYISLEFPDMASGSA
jgi:hypothetical protein